MTVVVTVFRVLATCTSVFMLLSPVPSILQIARTRSTGVGSIVPLVAMLTNAHFIVLFGYMSKQYFPVFSTFVVGEILALAYIAIFYRFTHEKAKAHHSNQQQLVTLYAVLGGFGVTGQSRHAVGQILGYVTILSSALFYSSPMERIGLVLQRRSAAFLNIHMIAAGTLNNAVWIVYTSLVHEWIIFAPNAFCFSMGVVQISLYWIFHPSTHPLPAETEADALEAGMCVAVPSPVDSGMMKSDATAFALVSSPMAPLHPQPKQP